MLRCILFWLLTVVVPSLSCAAERPNILWITAEDFSPMLGCYGDAFARTPNIDAFAREAVRYTRAFAFAPVCAPSRVTLITGVNANSVGNPHLRSEFTLPPDFKGYAAYLRQAGYFTTNNVKTDYNLRNESEIARSWWDRVAADAHWRQRKPGQPFMAVFNFMESHQSRLGVMSAEEFEREIGSKLSKTQRADPALVPVPPFYPDLPITRHAMARLYDCVTAMDKRVGGVLAELAADGLAEETIVFFYSDHGMGMPRGKRLLHDSGMRVPLLIRFPKKWAHLAPAPAGRTVDRLVTFVDFAPTLLSLAGVAAPKHFQGMAFLGQAAGEPRNVIFGARDRVDEVFDTSRSVRDARWLYIRNYRPDLSWAPPEGYSDHMEFRRELRAMAQAGKLGRGPTAWLAPTRAREELYDTEADPHQLVNLAADPKHAETLQRMRRQLRTWVLEVRDTAFVPEEEVLARSRNTSAYEAARNGEFPLARILDAAEAVGDLNAVAQQRAWLRDDDAAVRYWAAVGFAANAAGARESRSELERAMRDDSAAVRIEAAGALLSTTGDAKARELLLRELGRNESYPALRAARTLELLGRTVVPDLAPVRARREMARGRQRGEPLELSIGFALDGLLRGSESR